MTHKGIFVMLSSHSSEIDLAQNGDVVGLRNLELYSGQGLHIGARDEYGASLVHLAARSGVVAALEYLVKELKIDPKQRSLLGSTPLHDAAAAGKLEVVQWLLKNTDLDVNDQVLLGVRVLIFYTKNFPSTGFGRHDMRSCWVACR